MQSSPSSYESVCSFFKEYRQRRRGSDPVIASLILDVQNKFRRGSVGDLKYDSAIESDACLSVPRRVNSRTEDSNQGEEVQNQLKEAKEILQRSVDALQLVENERKENQETDQSLEELIEKLQNILHREMSIVC